MNLSLFALNLLLTAYLEPSGKVLVPSERAMTFLDLDFLGLIKVIKVEKAVEGYSIVHTEQRTLGCDYLRALQRLKVPSPTHTFKRKSPLNY